MLRRHAFPELSAALMAGALGFSAPALAQSDLPDFGDSSAATLSPADERRLGEMFLREVRSRLVLVDDPEIEAYVDSLGQRLASGSDSPPQSFRFFVVAQDEINAFAGPGGHIGINAGLVLNTESEGELASVLAHEIAHVTQRHVARRFEQQGRSRLPVFAGILAAIALGSQSAALGQATAAATIGTAAQRTLNFSREAEREADRVGMQLLERAGYDPRAMPAMLEKLVSASRFNRKLPEYLSTHPLTVSRIADLKARAERYPYRERKDDFRYRLMRARLGVLLGDDATQSLAPFEEATDGGEHPGSPADAYGRGLALVRGGDHEGAREAFAALVDEYPDELFFRTAQAENELAAGRTSRSIELYAEAYPLYPDNKALVYGFATALLRGGRAEEAIEVIEAYTRSHAPDPYLHRLAAEAYAQEGDSVRSRLSLAEHYYLDGRFDAALHQLRLASREEGAGYYLLSRVDARLEEIERELRSR